MLIFCIQKEKNEKNEKISLEIKDEMPPLKNDGGNEIADIEEAVLIGEENKNIDKQRFVFL